VVSVEFRVLGPLEAAVGGVAVDLGGPRQRVVLGMLLARAGQVVGLAALVDALWGGAPPPDAARTARAYVHRLRKALPAEAVLTRPPGYLLRPEPGLLDAARFETLAAAGSAELAAGRAGTAADWLGAALALWRGEAYGEFGDVPALRAEGARLAGLRLAALADRIAADLARGLGAGLVAEIDELTRAHPGHERLWGHLLIALYRAGRRSEALEAYERARAGLVEESGLEPSPALLAIHRQVLAQDPALFGPPAPAAVNAAAVGPGARPAQLPAATAGFAGRQRELAELDRALAGAAAVVISAVSGTAGVGKTALAVHWAHQVADRFPDGQLYVNLRGFAPGGAVLGTGEAIRGFLDGLGVPAERIPAGVDEQAALWRASVAGRRVLVVLDNARDAEQVRPLLPGTPSAFTVITSRNQLAGLVATDGARPVRLDPLSTGEARELLTARLGADRPAAEPDAVTEIVDRCARLPLALSITAARAALHPGFSLTTLAAELAEAEGRFDALDAGEPASSVRAAFSWSYEALAPAAAELFRLLGLHPGPDIAAAAAASLAGRSVPAVRPLLAELTAAGLLAEPAPGRWTCHDLLRAYATEESARVDPAAARDAATDRMLDHYTHTALAADHHLDPSRDPSPWPATEPTVGAAVLPLPDPDTARAWLAAELPVMLAALRLAADTGRGAHTWHLSWALTPYLNLSNRWDDLLPAREAALAAAVRHGDPAVVGSGHRILASAHLLLGQRAQARTHHERALELALRHGDVLSQARSQVQLSSLCEAEGERDRALGHAREALAGYERLDHQAGIAVCFNQIGWLHALAGDHAAAIEWCRRALPINQRDGNAYHEALTWDSIGYAQHHLGEYANAVEAYERSLRLFGQVGPASMEAATLDRLGDTQLAAGDPAAARAAWLRAVDIYTDLDLPHEVTPKLAALGDSSGDPLADLVPDGVRDHRERAYEPAGDT
jgi:DNA-binding SARP family transcriptional activator/Tfp pilus assembly protein PilF